MKADNELVMAVRTEELFRAGYFQGLQAGGDAWLKWIFEPQRSRFLPRAEAENDPRWKQVIPYVMLSCGDAVFTYRRGRRSSETRLRELHSVGLGGHIRHSDESMFAAPGWEAYRAGLERELAEEVEVGAAVTEDRLVGLINDDSSEVGRVHIGLVHLRRVGAPAVRARETKIAGGRFVPVAELAGSGSAFESWSELCLLNWERLQAQPGWLPAAAELG